MKNRTYGDIDEKYALLETSKVVLIPIPYDGTSTWQKGANNGPDAFLEATKNMELFDIETMGQPHKEGIYITPFVLEKSSPEKVVETVYKTTKKYLQKDKFVTLFGGEHSISIGAIQSFNEFFEDLTVVQMDAHADLRPTYNGSECNHACALSKANKTTNLIQVGIRSMSKKELEYMNSESVFFSHKLSNNKKWMKKALKRMTKNVFITFDLDVFDSSLLPSTGTPEPGGMLWYQTLEFLQKIFKNKNVVGFDIVELCPNPKEKSSDFIAAKLYYKMLAFKFNKNE